MEIPQNLISLGFTKYEAQVYLALIAENPLNGSQLSRSSGVPRANIYNVLDSLKSREIITLVGENVYAPIPPEELIKRLKTRHAEDLSVLKAMTDQVKNELEEEYIWAITDYNLVMAKAREIIASAKYELFVRLFPQEAQLLKVDLKNAEARGVEIKYISFGIAPVTFQFQVVHPEVEELSRSIGGRSINIVADEREVITGKLKRRRGGKNSTAWAKNHWLAFSTRDAMRHDFYHVFLHKIYELGEELSEDEKRMYNLIKKDFWRSTSRPGPDRKRTTDGSGR